MNQKQTKQEPSGNPRPQHPATVPGLLLELEPMGSAQRVGLIGLMNFLGVSRVLCWKMLFCPSFIQILIKMSDSFHINIILVSSVTRTKSYFALLTASIKPGMLRFSPLLKF